ncbi:MAG TPA: septum formation initiator family protein [Gemmatimonadaceae bacterium]
MRVPRRLVLWSMAVFALYAAVECGEYSTIDLLRQRSREAALQQSIDSLRRDIDSLQRLARLLKTDPATQERVAREQFGMVRGENELLYRFIDPDSLSERRTGR